MAEVLIRKKSKFNRIGVIDFLIVGSHEFKLLRSNAIEIDVVMNYMPH